MDFLLLATAPPEKSARMPWVTLRKSRVVVHRRGDSGRGAKTVQFAAGIDDQFAPEQVSSFHRNRWSVSPGITVQFAPEYAFLLKETGELAKGLMQEHGSRQ
jgi:hypothetical protein